ncbi:unnamed protein product [Durusdinium trenchii]|uniref:Fe2OG dioxygenase domain-containing protein n=1 Tax=Durusdinium trenchii TaxID=1381693 RepID=A0ABP0N7V3_9DINO
MVWKECELPEASLYDCPLPLLGCFGGPPSFGHQVEVGQAETIIWDESRRCFAFHWRSLLDQASTETYFHKLQTLAPWDQLKGRKGQILRSTSWYVRDGCTCDYTYGDARVSSSQTKSRSQFVRIMEELTATVFSTLTPSLGPECWPNSANLNYYADGTQSVGWHADDETLFGGESQDCSIISLSLGGRREFWIALKDESMEPIQDTIVEMDLRDGDVLSMEGLMQKHTVHFLTREPVQRAGLSPPRINITWRWIVNHRRACALRHCPVTTPSAKIITSGANSKIWTRPWWQLGEAWHLQGVETLHELQTQWMEGWPELCASGRTRLMALPSLCQKPLLWPKA